MRNQNRKDHPFDDLAKRFAAGFSRRAALRYLTRGGVAAALLTAFGRESPAAVQGGATTAGVAPAPPGRTPEPCKAEFEATVRQGSSTGLVLRGFLGGTVAEAGEILQGVLVLLDGTRIPVAGQTNGHAINLVIQLGPGRNLYGVGTLDDDVRLCKGTMGGLFTGPLPGDIGDWSTPVPLTHASSNYCHTDPTVTTPCPSLGSEF